MKEEDEEDVDAALQLLLVVANMMWSLVCAAYFFLKEYPRAVFSRSARVLLRIISLVVCYLSLIFFKRCILCVYSCSNKKFIPARTFFTLALSLSHFLSRFLSSRGWFTLSLFAAFTFCLKMFTSFRRYLIRTCPSGLPRLPIRRLSPGLVSFVRRLNLCGW